VGGAEVTRESGMDVGAGLVHPGDDDPLAAEPLDVLVGERHRYAAVSLPEFPLIVRHRTCDRTGRGPQ
jgi:hypothetical protein